MPMNSNTAKLSNALGAKANQFGRYMFGGNMVPNMNTLQKTGTNSNGQMTFTADMMKDKGKIYNTLVGNFTQDPVTALMTAGAYAGYIKQGINMARFQREQQQEQRRLEAEQKKLAQEQQKAAQQQANNESADLVKIGNDYYKKVDDPESEKTKELRKLATKALVAGSKKATKEYRKDKATKAASVNEGVGNVAAGFGSGVGDFLIGQGIQNAASFGLQKAGELGANAYYKLSDTKAQREKVKAEREALKLDQKYQKEQKALAKKANIVT